MRQIQLLIAVCASILFNSFAQSNPVVIETENYVSETSNVILNDIQVIRAINGGTIITPVFDSSCPEEIKAPFEYACKIMEEYMLPCYPIKVKISCNPKYSSNAPISSVSSILQEDFGESPFRSVPITMIKGVHLGEIAYGSPHTFVRYLDKVNLSFFTDPDIEITYNTNKFNEISFSLLPSDETKYDFVSLVLRDLFVTVSTMTD